MRLLVSAVVLFGLVNAAHAQQISADEARPEEPTVFDAFKSFCVETDIEKEAINAKASSLGAIHLNIREGEVDKAFASFAGVKISRAAWVAKLGARQFEIYSTSMESRASPDQHPIHKESCHVIFRGDDAQGINEMEHWIDMSDSDAIKLPAMGEKSFEFETVNGKHVPLPKTWRVESNFSKTIIWQAEISQLRGIDLSLERTKPF